MFNFDIFKAFSILAICQIKQIDLICHLSLSFKKNSIGCQWGLWGWLYYGHKYDNDNNDYKHHRMTVTHEYVSGKTLNVLAKFHENRM